MSIGTTQNIGNFIIERPNKIEVNIRHRSLYLGGCLLKTNFLDPREIRASVFTTNKRGGEPVYRGCNGAEAMTILMQWLQDMEQEQVKP